MKNKKIKMLQFCWICLLLLFTTSNQLIASITFTDVSDSTINFTDSLGILNLYDLDLDQNGTVDFIISTRSFESYEGREAINVANVIEVQGVNSNEISIGPFYLNDPIDSLNYFQRIAIIIGHIPGNGIVGHWEHMTYSNDDVFVGLSLSKNGQNYYGWLKIKTNEQSVTIESFAFNTTPNSTILAGQIN
ncbi:MAG TPA: hypothetical protein PK904_13800 [Bacteroidales bacterium]|nr:hypothetical protein [Bacteroidales bacterium]